MVLSHKDVIWVSVSQTGSGREGWRKSWGHGVTGSGRGMQLAVEMSRDAQT